MLRHPIHIGLCLLILNITAGCDSRRYTSQLPSYMPLGVSEMRNNSVGRFKVGYLAEYLYRNMNHPARRGNIRMAVLPLIDLEDFKTTSALGMVVGEQLISELKAMDFEIVEIRTMDQIYISKKAGEIYLQRGDPFTKDIDAYSLQILRERYQLDAVVCGTFMRSRVDGTYDAGPIFGLGRLFSGRDALFAGMDALYAGKDDREVVFLNVRMVDLLTHTVLSAASAETSVPLQLLKAKHMPALKLNEVNVAQVQFEKRQEPAFEIQIEDLMAHPLPSQDHRVSPGFPRIYREQDEEGL